MGSVLVVVVAVLTSDTDRFMDLLLRGSAIVLKINGDWFRLLIFVVVCLTYVWGMGKKERKISASHSTNVVVETC
jgi:hypothetical protein